MKLTLNCDLAEIDNGVEALVMPHIDLANIACGVHAGDMHLIQRTLQQAKQHKVAIGAHPSYNDRANFGRTSMVLTAEQIEDLVLYQLGAVHVLAVANGQQLSYVKPHGALYNDMISTDMMADSSVFSAILSALVKFAKAYHQPQPLKLMVLATANAKQHIAKASHYGVELILEAFADRRYTDQGLLMQRTQNGAVLNEQQTLAQAQQLVTYGTVTTESGKQLALPAQTLCVHGDNEAGVKMIKALREICQ